MDFNVKLYSMNISRSIENGIEKFISKKTSGTNILFIWGPRRSGKTTLLKKIARKHKSEIFNFDYLNDQNKFTPYRQALDKLVAKNKIIFIDEVQNSPQSTRPIKILNDNYNIKIIVIQHIILAIKPKKQT